MKILFMGTPDFSVPVLEGLIQSDKHQVVAVVTQPDKPRGRSGKLIFSPIKEVAVRENIPVLQPIRIKNEDEVSKLKTLEFDVAVVVAFGQILSKEILELPKYGCINVHASLLPKWRGAAPIQWSILAGDKETGVTTMQMDEGIDTGDMLLTKKVTIDSTEIGDSLFQKLSEISSEILLDTLVQIEENTIVPCPQNSADCTFAPMLKKELGRLDFTKEAQELERYVRGLNSWPSAYTTYRDKTLKIWQSEVDLVEEEGVPGQIVKVEKNHFCVKTGKGLLRILMVQLEGKRAMTAGDFLRGIKMEEGEILGQSNEYKNS